MAAGNNGASTPEDDDPFGYLYADGQATGTQSPRQGGGYGYPGPAAQPGVPRTSYNQVRAVGERQYGQVPHQHQPQQPYGQPTAQYAAPETYGQVPPQSGPRHPQPQRPGRGGPNTKGLLLGAIAVVAVVVIGITAAVLTNGDEKKEAGGGTPSGGSTQVQESPSARPSESADQPSTDLPKQDAATLRLGPPAALATDIKGAEGTDGAYVTNFNAVGASVTWKAKVETKGKYRLYVRYAIPMVDANATLTINGKANTSPIGLKNFRHSTDPAWENNWQTTWAPVELKQGDNEIKISCEQGNQCNAILDWLEVRPDTPGA
ncbi:CBM35 domain-containing protein [Streptomyces purpureus]|uniref:CBM6 domain-containing protein n=1 Tax=Streptomyces purpureus TaxID=1951 RepID=A0A918LXA8_9ACTN|nr:CBM35 domain-containing protein [Streptomyces purpureus]GGT66184.1 hypothetical protein GCM10014713_68630 [Streptomyces purpureus]